MSSILHLVTEEGSLVHLESDSGFGEGSEDFVDLKDVFLDGF